MLPGLGGGPVTRVADPATRLNTGDIADRPLSEAQLRWWVAQQLNPGLPHTVAMYLDLTGPLRIEPLREAAAMAAWDLQSPHVRFRIRAGGPRQYLDPEAFDTLRVVDLAGTADPIRTASEQMAKDYGTPLDLLRDRLSTAVVYRLEPQRHLLYLRSHHIVLDGVGAAAVLRRTAELYADRIGADPVGPVTREPLSIGDLVADEAAYRDSDSARADAEYWREQLAELPSCTGLSGTTAPAEPTPHRIGGPVPETTARRLAQARARTGAGFTELTIAAFAGYLAAMTGRDDAVVALPLAVRPTAALRHSAGSLSNVVPLRLRGVGEATVSELIDQVRLGLIGALRHQRYRGPDPRPGRRENRVPGSGFGPVVNVLGFGEPLRLGSVTGQAVLLAQGPVEDLLISAYQLGADEHSARVDMLANPALYSRATLAWHHEHFLTYLHDFLGAAPDQVISGLSPRDLVVVPPRRVTAGARTLPELLRRAVDADPDAIAVVDGDRRWTYREWDEWGARWARELLEHGVGPGDSVPVALPRSAESVLALWAIAMTGAAFDPIDPSGPSVAPLSGSQARVGITSSAVRSGLPDGPEWIVLDSPECVARVAGRSGAAVASGERIRRLRPDHPAYVVPLSASRRRSRAVVVTHRGLADLTRHIVDTYAVRADSRVLHAHTPSFDAHLLELLAAFAAGARLIVEPPAVVAGAELRDLLRERGITHLLSTPAILATLQPCELPRLRVVVVGGEVCPPHLARRWRGCVRLFNSYGPSETTVMATQCEVREDDGAVPIGTTLPGVRALVLDERLLPVPPGRLGELYLGGDGVAQGYRGDPAATAAHFVADPQNPGRRCYRTGDLVRIDPAGVAQFLGRRGAR